MAIEHMTWDKAGAGPAICLLHGFAADYLVWNPVVQVLEQNHTCIVPHLPGHGRATGHVERLEDVAEGLEAIRQQIGIPQWVLCGHSMGGYIAMEYALKYPDRLSGLVMFHSHPFGDPEEKRTDRDKTIRFIETNGPQAYLKKAVPPMFSDPFRKAMPEAVDAMMQRTFRMQPKALTGPIAAMRDRANRQEVLEQAPCPVMVVAGRFDQHVPMEWNTRQAEMDSVGHFVILEHSAHLGMVEEPQTSARVLADFVAYRLQ
jgi:pimeloyl-ACP methyl ester carboxylesterase